jgi:flavin-dependent dehydrogenase
VYDAIVIGARCAGSPTAMLLARQGHRVLLLDRARFPSDKPISSHMILRPGGAALARWGLLDRVIGLGAPPVREFSVDFGPLTLTSDSPDDGAASAVYLPRRILLDKLLLDAALEAGVEFREDFSVRELLWDGDRVVGVRGGSKGGASIEERAKVVVGADGLASVVARGTGAPRYHDVATQTGVWWGYFRGLNLERVHVWARPRRLLGAAASNDDLSTVMVYMSIDDFHEFTADVEGNVMSEFREHVPELHERLRNSEREGQWLGTGYQPNFFRQSAGPGWALVGDAGCHHDSINPSGMSVAFTGAEMLAEAIHAGLTGERDLDEALRDYQARRDARWLGHWHFAVGFARMEPPAPEFVGLLQALGERPAATRRFFGYFEGQEAELGFMDPENLGRIMTSSS